MTSEYVLDPQARAFLDAIADKLAAAGNAVEYVCYGGLIHGCCNMTGIMDQAQVVLDDAAAALRRGLG